MNGALCHRREKTMEGTSGAEERPCRSIYRVYSRSTATRSETASASDKRHDVGVVGVDFFSQARKTLSQRSPFDIPEGGGSSSCLLSVPTLPSGLASLLKQTDKSKKKHKKSSSGPDKKSSRQGEKAKETGIWVEKEVYFRDITLPDIDSLSDITLSRTLAARRKCFLIPYVENEPKGNSNLYFEVDEKVNVSNENDDVVKEGKNAQLMEIGSAGFVPNATTSSLEWILGCRNRIFLTSERPSKKRKLVEEDAAMEKILIACPCDGNSSLCHFCCTGDKTKESNKLIVCSSCKVAVHKKCYGVQKDVDSSWLCSPCSDDTTTVKTCVLCPKQGGALKPIGKNDENGSPVEFAHLFCSQWMPEVHIEDLEKMEPIINAGGINDTRNKLVCDVCKVKFGACVRCSHGTCRTSFHPLCAREARHRMEVWGRYGCDNVELRAFCSKHSELNDNSSSPQDGELCASGIDSSITNQLSQQSMDESQNLKGTLRNGDKIAVEIEAPDDNSDKSGDGGLLERTNDDEHTPYNSLNFAMILKKLIDRGKVNVKDVALEIGLSADSLTASLNNDSVAPDMRCKIGKWLSNHARMGSSQKNLKVNIKSSISSKDDTGSTDISDNIVVSKSDTRRRTKNNVTILRDNKVICSSDEIIDDIGVVMDDVKVDLLAKAETNDSSKVSILDTTGKNSAKPDGSQDSSERHFHTSKGNSTDLVNDSNNGRSQSERAITPEKKTDQGNSSCPIVNPIIADLIRNEEFSNFYIHPYTQKQLMQMNNGMFCKNSEVEGRKEKLNEFDGAREGDLSRLAASSNASVCCSHQSEHPKCNEKSSPSDDLELSVKARKLGYFKFSPEDEVEGEIIYYQHRLLSNAVARNPVTDNLVSRVAKSLPHEVETARTKIWDTILVNQYLYELREAKKQGRKERRHKEAQAVLAAATAAVAASSRISSSRKDGLEDSSHQESLLKQNASVGRTGISSQARASGAFSRNIVPRISSEKYSDIIQSVTDLSKGHPRSCDICRRSETVLNPILVCSGCKVAVHLDCYRNVKETTGPWRCELCEQLFSSRSSGAPSLNFWEKPYPAVECGLCGGTTGAFRKSVDDHWVHAFCAEWVLESTFKRGQVNPVEGMEMATRGIDICCICGCKHGACIKCSYGHCQITFHPSCARSAGFCMNVKLGGGKLHHRAYCEQHSVEQRAKTETQKHGIEELKNMKQIRVELERLRLLCERIIKREKLKRELVLCSQQVLACKRDHVTRSVLFSPFFRPDVSSESATTSLKGHTEDNKSCSEAMRSDDVTVDSSLSVKKVPVPVDQRTDDSSTSQSLFVRKPTERAPFSGKQIPHRYSLASRNALDNAEWNSKFRKPIETFEKELVMTSDEASMKNSRLPKGYCYVPVDCIPKEKQVPEDACSDGQLEHNG